MLKNENEIRVIVGSANLTENGIYGRNQVNNVIVSDYVLDGNPENEKAIRYYHDYFNDTKKNCELFMEDLVSQLMNQADSIDD